MTPDKLPRCTDGVVVIRAERLDELEAHLAGEDDDIRRWFHFPRPSAHADVEAYIERSLASFAAGGPRRSFAVADARTDQLCGTVEANHLGDGVVNLSYSLHRRVRGRGYATRAARLCMAHAAEALAVDRFVIRVDPRNTPSIRLVERLDFRFRGGHIEDGRPHWEFDHDLVGEGFHRANASGNAEGTGNKIEELLTRAHQLVSGLDPRWSIVAARFPSEAAAVRDRVAQGLSGDELQSAHVVAWEGVQRLMVLEAPTHRVEPEALASFLGVASPLGP